MFFPVRPNSDRTRTPKSSSVKTKKRRSALSSTKDPELETTARSSTSTSSHTATPRRSSMPGIDTASRSGTAASFLESRSSLPYPNFSKAHSKEDVRHTIPTPDPTDLTEVTETPKTSERTNGVSQSRDNHHAPPSPPLTGLSDQPSRKGTPVEEREEKMKTTKKTNIKIRTTEINRSSSSLRSKKEDGVKSSSKSRTDSPKTKSSRTDKEKSEKEKSSSHKSSKSKPSDEKKLPKQSSRSTISPASPSASNVTTREILAESINGSDATSIAPNQQHNVPRKPPSPPLKPPSRDQTRSAASHRHTLSEESIEYGRQTPSCPSYGPPPPPPPPPEVPISIPRVDYLLQYGGLDHRVPRTLLIPPSSSDPFFQQGTQPQQSAAKVFDPFNSLLDDYTRVMSKNGSLAVATGYRSVARRLLDRLEAVFARDISSEPCSCQMCDHEESEERPSGVSWGEVLELVSGRRELPMWPPFKMAATTADADMLGEEHIPMQKLDVDVPEEYRDHFIRQSRKTKAAVDKWLSEQTTEQSTSAPHEVDDETLTFSMLTYLEPIQRSLFCALLGINSATPVPRSDKEEPRTKPSALVSSSLAIQRLYRLKSLPRDPETAMFMLNNHHLHHVLATLAAITDDEWDILISGRFDGFLRSGAEDCLSPSNTRWSGSRSNTPGNGAIPRGTTPNYMDASFRPNSQLNGGPPSPSSYGGPIALDEETEIAALAEIERDIFLGMEALEDAFEVLHLKAEVVRRALRERGAGLSVANQSRRGSHVEARLGTPFSAVGAWEGVDEDFLEDDRGSLAPDDSASNISSNRRRRPKRRTERRTPAPVEEEDEEDSQAGRRERNSRRR